MSAAGRYSMIELASAGLGLALASDRRYFLWFIAGIVAEWIFTNGPFKLIFRRERPDNSDVVAMLPGWLHPPRSSSFPSGHSSAAAFAAVLWWNWSPVIGVIAVVLALGMGASRIIIRAHHRTDVLAGLVWGTLLGLGAVQIIEGLGS